MSDFVQRVKEALEQFEPASVIDIVIIAAVIYGVLLLLRRTTAMPLLRGVIIVVAAVFIMARLLELTLLDWLLRNGWPALLIAIPVIFQPEIRRALERLGRAGRWTTPGHVDYEAIIDAVTGACENLAENHHGAIIVLERETGLEDYIETGVRVDGALSPQLLEGIFFPNSPLHDGAAIVRGNRIAAAACTLPLANTTAAGHLGTRHRAAMGIAEVTDAVAVVVSEETGQVSAAASGRMISRLDSTRLRALLLSLYVAAARREGRRLRRRIRV